MMVFVKALVIRKIWKQIKFPIVRNQINNSTNFLMKYQTTISNYNCEDYALTWNANMLINNAYCL